MDGPRPISLSLPRPGRALWAVLVAMTVVGIVTAGAAAWVPAGDSLFLALTFQLNRAFTQPWRLLSSGLLTSPQQWSHLLFSLVGLYFLGAPLERRWGGFRFLRFLAAAVLLGNLATVAVAALLPVDDARFHPEAMFGPAAAIAAIAVAWSREFPDSTVNLFFVVPVRGRVFLWITLGFCMLDLVYPAGVPEGVVAPFGGVAAGLLLGGSPSLARAAWLRLRLAMLRSSSNRVRADDLLSAKIQRRPRASGPPLRVLTGGLDDVLKKRTPPKDKRYLN